MQKKLEFLGIAQATVKIHLSCEHRSLTVILYFKFCIEPCVTLGLCNLLPGVLYIQVHLLLLLPMYLYYPVLLAIPLLSDFQNITVTSTVITLSWTAPHFVPTRYNLTCVCTLLCGTTSFTHVLTPQPTDTLANVTGLLPGSECNVSLTAIYDRDDSFVVRASLITSLQSEWHNNYLLPHAQEYLDL